MFWSETQTRGTCSCHNPFLAIILSLKVDFVLARQQCPHNTIYGRNGMFKIVYGDTLMEEHTSFVPHGCQMGSRRVNLIPLSLISRESVPKSFVDLLFILHPVARQPVYGRQTLMKYVARWMLIWLEL